MCVCVSPLRSVDLIVVIVFVSLARRSLGLLVFDCFIVDKSNFLKCYCLFCIYQSSNCTMVAVLTVLFSCWML